MKSIKFVKITHKVYGFNSDDAQDKNSGYSRAISNMWDCLARLVNELRAKYTMYSCAPEIMAWTDGDSDDDVFEYGYIKVPVESATHVQQELRRCVGNYGRGWEVSIDAQLGNEYDVEYTMLRKSLRPGQRAYFNNTDVDKIGIYGVTEYNYNFKRVRDRNGEYRLEPQKSCYINTSGLSTKLICSLSYYDLDPKSFKTKLPKDAVEDGWHIHHITVYMDEKNRANLMRIAKKNPSVLRFYRQSRGEIAIANKDKSDFIKTFYSAKDKEAKAKAETK